MNQAHAATENETIHECHCGFGVFVDVGVQCVLLLKEDFVLIAAGFVAVVQHANVAPGAKCLAPIGTQHHRENLGILLPGMQLL
ncbi:hypothetical protein D9M69_490150 [compost metagenome]